MRHAGSMGEEGKRMFTGKTKNLAIMGWPVEHSLSPAMQNAALARAGLDYAYIALPVPPESLEKAVAGLKSMGFCGWNVTIPHKTAIMSFLDELDDSAEIIGAVNTVVHRDGKLKGYNTDAAGFLRGLEQANIDLSGQQVIVLGAGGAARAVLWGLCKAKAKKIVLGVRNPAKAEALARRFRDLAETEIFGWEEPAFREEMKKAALLVNTTPLGMAPKTEEMPPVDLSLLPETAAVYDIIYTPARTRLLREAERLGHLTVNGEYMLSGQGAEAFWLWTGRRPDENLMRETLRASLKGN